MFERLGRLYGVARGAPNVNARFFELGNGGYDTHSDQGADSGAQADLHGEVAGAIKLFFEDLADMSAGAGAYVAFSFVGAHTGPGMLAVVVHRLP